MQCVIIAAGKGTRMRPLTDTLPKPLITVCGKPILAHIVKALPPVITELIIVVGYRGEQIRAYCGDTFHGRPVTFVEQEHTAAGTGAALMLVEPLVTGRFLFMYADDIHGSAAIAEAVTKPYAMLVTHSDTPELYGVVSVRANGTLEKIVEKPEVPETNLINIGGFVLDQGIFAYPPPVSRLGERLATDMLTAFAAEHPVTVVTQPFWQPLGKPEDIPRAEAVLCGGVVEKTSLM